MRLPVEVLKVLSQAFLSLSRLWLRSGDYCDSMQNGFTTVVTRRMDQEEDTYLAMLNNSAINPPDSGSLPETGPELSPLKQDSLTCKASENAKDTLEKAASGLVLSSETDAPFQWFHATWSKDSLPEPKELGELGIPDAESVCRTRSLKEFLEPLTVDDDSKSDSTFSKLLETFRNLFGEKETDTRVYLIGELTITILILGLVKDDEQVPRALAGLQSIQVET